MLWRPVHPALGGNHSRFDHHHHHHNHHHNHHHDHKHDASPALLCANVRAAPPLRPRGEDPELRRRRDPVRRVAPHVCRPQEGGRGNRPGWGATEVSGVYRHIFFSPTFQLLFTTLGFHLHLFLSALSLRQHFNSQLFSSHRLNS